MTSSAVAQIDLVFAVEPFATAYADAGDLVRLHWDEIAKNKQLLTINPDEAFYDRGDRAKRILVVTARHESKLVGYFVWFLFSHPHYKHVQVAEGDIQYLLPEYRRGMNGYRLIKEACEFARQAGAQLLTIRFKVDKDHPELMRRLGFARTDVTYTLAT